MLKVISFSVCVDDEPVMRNDSPEYDEDTQFTLGEVAPEAVSDIKPKMHTTAAIPGTAPTGESFAAHAFRNVITNRLIRETGRSRGEVTEAVLDIEGLSKHPILQFLLQGALDVLIALIKSKLGL